MGIKYIRDYYKVPAKRGSKIIFTDGEGQQFLCTIFSTIGSCLKVRVKGVHDKKGYWILHPTWNIEYLAEGI
jgi:hypothetical protein